MIQTTLKSDTLYSSVQPNKTVTLSDIDPIFRDIQSMNNAGAESATLIGTDVNISIEAGVSTSNQIKTAIDAKAEILALVTVTVDSSAAQAAQSITNLAGGISPTIDWRIFTKLMTL